MIEFNIDNVQYGKVTDEEELYTALRCMNEWVVDFNNPDYGVIEVSVVSLDNLDTFLYCIRTLVYLPDKQNQLVSTGSYIAGTGEELEVFLRYNDSVEVPKYLARYVDTDGVGYHKFINADGSPSEVLCNNRAYEDKAPKYIPDAEVTIWVEDLFTDMLEEYTWCDNGAILR